MDGMGKNRRPWVTGSLPEGDYREKLVDLLLVLVKFHDHRDSRGRPRKEKSIQANRSMLHAGDVLNFCAVAAVDEFEQ
jgi:hypothetical protein